MTHTLSISYLSHTQTHGMCPVKTVELTKACGDARCTLDLVPFN